MAIKIKPLRKFTTGTPSTSDMVEGELAVNTADKKVFMRDDSNNIVEVGAASSLSLPIGGGTLTGDLRIEDNSPTIIYNDLNESTDNKAFQLTGSGGTLSIQYLNDSFGGGGGYINFARTDNNLDSLDMYRAGNLKNRFSTSGDNYILSGNVGIGTTSPEQLLHIRYSNNNTTLNNNAGDGNNLTSGLRVNNTSTTSNTYASIDLRANNADVRLASINKGANTSDFVVLVDKAGNTTLDEALRITSEGNMNLTSSADGGPVLSLISNDHSDAQGFTTEGTIRFLADNDADQSTEFAKIRMLPSNVSDGNEHGWLYFNNIYNGANTANIAISSSGSFYLLSNATDNPVIEWNSTGGTSFDVQLRTVNPTADRTISLPDATGTLLINTGNQTLTGDLTFPDNEKAVFGTDGDLDILFDGTDPIIRNNRPGGSGNLKIVSGGTIQIRNVDDTESMANFFSNGRVELYFNGSKKLETTDTGVTFEDDVKAQFGTGEDLSIFHNGTNSKINNTTGALQIVNFADDQDVIISTDDGSGSTANYFRADGSTGEALLYHYGSEKLKTQSTGITVTGTTSTGALFANGSIGNTQSAKGVYAGLSTAGDAQIALVGDNTDISPQIDFSHDVSIDYDVRLILENQGNRLSMKSHGNETMANFNGDGAVELYHDNNKKIETTSTGVTVTGSVTATTFSGTASNVTVSDSSANTNFPVVFHDESNALLDDTGALRYNPSTGTLLAPNLVVAGTTTTVNTVTMEAANAIVFEGATADAHETTLTITDPTADRTITLPNATGQVVLSSGTIDSDASAEIGKAHIGYMGWDDLAGFSHVDTNAQNSYALLQSAGGITYLNAANGQTIKNRINNVTIFETSATGVTLSSGYTLTTPFIRLNATGDVSPSSTTHPFQIGASNSTNIAMDSNEIMARDNGSTSVLYLNAEGSAVVMGGGLHFQGSSSTQQISFEGSTDDDYEVFLKAENATSSDKIITLPNTTGTAVVGTSVFPSGTTNTNLPTPGAISLATPVENDDHVFHPYLNNDLGHFIERGGSYAWSGLSSNPTEAQTDVLFRANSDFVIVNNSNFTGTTATLTLTNLPKILPYSAYVGIVFGHSTFSPDSLVIETSTDGGSNWTTRLTDSTSKTHYVATFDTSNTSTNAIRFTFGKNTAGQGQGQTSIRIQSITAYNYNSSGMENYFLPLRGGIIYGDLSLTKSSGDTKLILEADSDNDTEGDNAFLIYKLDGGVETSAIWTGNKSGSNENALNLSNATAISGGIKFYTSTTNGGWESANERMRIDTGGDITLYGANANIVFDRSADALEFADDTRAKFGTGDDLQIYHNGSNSYIDDGSGTGALIFKSNTYSFRNAADDEQIAVFNENGAVELYFNGGKKFQTRSNGFAYIDDDVNIEITNQANFGAIEIGGSSGAFIDLKSPQTDDYDARIQLNTSNNLSIYSDDLHLASKTAETYLDATANGAVNLYYDNVLRLFTKDTGIRVMGSNASHANVLTYGPSSSPTVFIVKVVSTNQYHPYNGDGSSNKYSIDGEIGAAVELHGADAITSNSEYYYRFDQSDSSNSGHPLRFYLTADKTTEYTTGVTTNGTPGSSGAYTQIAVTMSTPKTLYYQCSAHAYMGNYVTVVNSSKFSEGITVSGGSSGDVLIAFDTDRSWQFQQAGDGSSTRLQLKSNVGSKFFDIVESTGSAFASFYAHETNPSLTLTSTNADASEGPSFVMNRASASPAVNDLLGTIVFQGADSGGSTVNYGKITGIITDPTDGSEDGLIRFQSLSGGNLYTAYQIGYSGNFFYQTLHLMANVEVRFEGSTDDNYETILTVTDPTADRTITLPNATGTVLTTGNSDTPTTITSSSGVLVLVDDSGTMKKITPANLGIGGGGGGGSTAADDLTAGDAAVNLTTTSGNITIDAQASDSDIIFKGTDGGSDTTFLTLDGSDAGTALFNHNIVMVDNAYINIGTGDGGSNGDLRLRSNSTHGYVEHLGGGSLIFKGDVQSFRNKADDEQLAKFTNGGAVELYHNDSKKFETTSSGAKVTGTLDVNGAYTLPTSDGSANQVLQTNGSGALSFATVSGGGGGGSSAADDITIGDAAVSIATSSGDITIDTQGNGNDIIFKGTSTGGSDLTALRLDMSAEGNAIFNHDVIVGATGAFRFTDSHSSDAMTGIFVNESPSGQTNMIIQVGDDATGSNEDQVRIRHRNYGNANPQDLDIAIFKRDASDNTKGNTAFNGDVSVSGAFSATTKSFDIKHPTKEHMRLRYGVLEGPEHGVYIRGKLINSNVIELPEHWTGLVDEDTITVQLTPIGKFQKLYVKEINDNKITIGNSSFFSNKTECFYFVQGTRKDVDELEIEYEN